MNQILQVERSSAMTTNNSVAATRGGLPPRREHSGEPARFVRHGFTLVEMLIAVTLVLMIMLLFAEIFGLASESMTLQMAISDNDQQVRMLTTVLRADMDQRTFKSLVPFFPNEQSDNFESDKVLKFNQRQGYFYLSLNALADSTDNVLQFTIEAPADTPFYGKAATLAPLPSPGNVTAFWENTNQPDWDDGQGRPNGSAESQFAEVSYFMRGGSLYRRVMLLRQPISFANPNTVQPRQSAPNPGADYFDPATGLYSGEFWNDFDYAARNDAIAAPFLSTLPTAGARFIGRSELNNQNAPNSFPLGISRMRFGFDRVSGLPREFSDSSGSGFFIGRFTQEETSHPDFNYPHSLSVINGSNENPFNTSVALTDNLNVDGQTVPDGVLDEFANGARAGEDLLLSNVHEFRVEVWDDRLNEFVPIAHSRSDSGPDKIAGNSDDVPGDFHFGRRLNNSYFAPGGVASVFDTWHPFYDRDNADGADLDDPFVVPGGTSMESTLESPPFRPMSFDPTGYSAPLPTNAGPSPMWDHSGGTIYSVDDVVFAPTEDYDITDPFNPNNLNGVLDTGEDGSLPLFVPPNNVIDTTGAVPSPARAYYYRCLEQGVDAGGNPVPNVDQPSWGSTPGTRHLTSEGYLWEVNSNLRPVRSVRFVIRFLHPRSGKMRQLTLVHSMDGSR